MSDSDSEELQSTPSITYLLHNAAEAGDISTLTSLLKESGDSAAAGLSLANAVIVRLLTIHDEDDCSPLHLALLNGHVACARLLLEAGAPAEDDCDGNQPLHFAACLGQHAQHTAAAEELVDLLLRHGADPLSRDDCGRSPLHWAAVAGLSNAAEALLQAGAQVQARVALAMADDAASSGARASLPSMAEIQDNDANTPLHLSARYGQQGILRILVQPGRGWDVVALSNSRNRDGCTPLALAAGAGHWAAVQILLAASPPAANVVDKKGRTAAQLARLRGHLACPCVNVPPGIKDLARHLEGAQDSLLVVGLPVSASISTNRAASERTLILAPIECLLHRTHPEPHVRGAPPPPPENVNRLLVLTASGTGILRCDEFAALRWQTEGVPAVSMSDLLRVHDWAYVLKVREACTGLPDEPGVVDRLDPDTAISHGTYQAALVAAGSVCAAVDALMDGQARNVFCAVRPPGHHAGPCGVVTCRNDPNGSHGFCLFSNVAIGAAYAMHIYRRQGIQRVAILDFDVHHGNGTEACVANTVPGSRRTSFSTPYSVGQQTFPTFKPWLDTQDRENIFFASVQGYGRRSEHSSSWFYPGSGGTLDNAVAKPAGTGSSAAPARDATGPVEGLRQLVEDPFDEFPTSVPMDPSLAAGPRIINVGIPGPGSRTRLWQRAWRDKILPALANFKPDLILVSAGFDAHRKEDLNLRFIGVTEHDYEWLTGQIVQMANRFCKGRVVSVLEGGYNLKGGGLASAFARSAAAHVRALNEVHHQEWSPAEGEMERAAQARRREAKPAVAMPAPLSRPVLSPEVAAGPSLTSPQHAAIVADPVCAPEASDMGMDMDRQQLPAAQQVPVPSPQPQEGELEGGGKRRRRGAPVDYAAMNAIWEQEQADAKQAAPENQPTRANQPDKSKWEGSQPLLNN